MTAVLWENEEGWGRPFLSLTQTQCVQTHEEGAGSRPSEPGRVAGPDHPQPQRWDVCPMPCPAGLSVLRATGEPKGQCYSPEQL